MSFSKDTEKLVSTAAKILTEKLPKGSGDAFEIFYSKSRATKIDAKDQKVESLTSSADIGLSFRVQKNGRIGFSYTTSIEEGAIRSAIQDAIDISEHLPEDSTKHLKPFDEISHDLGDKSSSLPGNRYDEAGLKAPIEQKVELALSLEDRCKKLDPRIKTVRSASVSENEGETVLMNSFGQRLQSTRTLYTASVSCKAEENGDAQMGGDFQFSSHLKDLPFELCAVNSVQNATELLGATVPKTRVCPGIIRNDVVADLLEFIASSFFGEEIQKGRSMLKGKLNEKIFSSLITVVDDGLLPGGYSTRAFDGEGTRSQKTTVIENGKFSRMLHDRASAEHFKVASTGNSARGLKSPPAISVTNLYMENGTTPFDKMLRSANNGIVITGLMGVHTANAVTGAFSLGATGILIENGKMGKPVKGFALAGNVLDLFRDLTAVGNDRRFFGNVGASSIFLPELSISGS